jgi:transposase
MKRQSSNSYDDLNWREGRRKRAWELSQQGWRQSKIAEALGVTQGAVSQWLRQAQQGGDTTPLRRRAGGPTPHLSPEQRAQLPDLLRQGPQAFGFQKTSWTCEQVGELIKRRFGVTYHPSHIGRILRSLGWDLRQPLDAWHDPATLSSEQQDLGPNVT